MIVKFKWKNRSLKIARTYFQQRTRRGVSSMPDNKPLLKEHGIGTKIEINLS